MSSVALPRVQEKLWSSRDASPRLAAMPDKEHDLIDDKGEALRASLMEPATPPALSLTSSSLSLNAALSMPPVVAPMSPPVLPTLATVLETIEHESAPMRPTSPTTTSDAQTQPSPSLRATKSVRFAEAAPASVTSIGQPRGRTPPLASIAVASGLIAVTLLQQLQAQLSPNASAYAQQGAVTLVAAIGPVFVVTMRDRALRRASAACNLGAVLGPVIAQASGLSPCSAPLAKTLPAMLALTLSAQTARRMLRRGAMFTQTFTLRELLRISLPLQWSGATSFIIAKIEQTLAAAHGETTSAPLHRYCSVGACLVAATLVTTLADAAVGAGRFAHRSQQRNVSFLFTAVMIGLAVHEAFDAFRMAAHRDAHGARQS